MSYQGTIVYMRDSNNRFHIKDYIKDGNDK